MIYLQLFFLMQEVYGGVVKVAKGHLSGDMRDRKIERLEDKEN